MSNCNTNKPCHDIRSPALALVLLIGMTCSALCLMVSVGCSSDTADKEDKQPQPLVAVIGEATSVDCPDGGVVWGFGLDHNGNGTLEGDEIDDRYSLCHGAAGTSCSVLDNGDGTKTISCEDQTSVTVSDGTSCSVLDNGNGTKTISCEDQTSVTVSDGTSCSVLDNGNGTKTISCEDQTSVTVSDGTSCSILDNGDGTTTIDCDDGTSVTIQTGPPTDVLGGSYVINNAIDAAALAGYSRITGDLTIAARGLTALSLLDLTTVDGDLRIEGNDDLPDLSGLQSLASVGGSVFISNNAQMADLTLSALASIGLNLDIDLHPVANSLSLPTLIDVGGAIRVNTNSALLAIDAPELQSVGGAMEIRSNPELTSIDLPSLDAVLGIALSENTLLASVDLTALATTSFVQLGGNASLTSLVGLSGLAHADALTISLNAALTDLAGLEGLTTVGQLVIYQNDQLTDVSALTGLTSVSGQLAVYDNAILPRCNVLALRDAIGAANIGYEYIAGNDKPCEPNPASCVTQALGCLEDCAAQDDFQCQMHVHEGSLMLASQNDIDAASVFTGINGHLTISTVPEVTMLDLPVLTSITGNLVVESCATLDNLDGFDHLTTIGGDFRIANNFSLGSIAGFNGLTDVNGQFTIESNPALSSVSGFVAIADLAAGGLKLANNPALDELSGFANLTSISGALEIMFNNALGSIVGLESLVTVGGDMWLLGHTSLTEIPGLGALSSVAGNLHIQDNDLASLSGLATLASVPNGSIMISGNATLTSLEGLDQLTTVGYELTVAENANLTSLNGLGSLTTLARLTVEENPSLTDLSALTETVSISQRITFQNNIQLAYCEIQEWLDSLDTTFISITRSGNADPCIPVPTGCAGAGVGCVNDCTLSEGFFCGDTYPTTGAITIAYQSQVDALAPYAHVDGSITITTDSLTAISLPNLQRVEGSLTCRDSPLLTSLSGLSNLRVVGANLTVENCDDLSDLDGLQGITTVHGTLRVAYNSSLLSLNGLDNLAIVEDDALVFGNDVLASLNGLESLISVGGGRSAWSTIRAWQTYRRSPPSARRGDSTP
ncbi:hypothetical protein ACFL6C_00740 [Myxococcota bacterium]